jgi:hypothetical protein
MRRGTTRGGDAMAEPSGEISSWGTTRTFLKVGT